MRDTMADSTRQVYESPILGNLAELNCSQLPTYRDVIKCILFRKTKTMNENCGKSPSLSGLCNQLASDIAAVYQRASVPTVSVQRIVKQLQMYHDKYQNIMRSYKSRSETAHFKQKVKAFLDESNSLFDFSCCKCVNFANCNCTKEKQVPQIEQSFLSDQRGPRIMFIGSIDGRKTSEIEKKKNRKAYLSSLAQPGVSNSTTVETIQDDTDKSPLQLNTNDEGENTDASDDNDYLPPRTSMKRICSQAIKDIPQSPGIDKRQKVITRFKNLPYFAEACDRVGISDRGAALLSTSLLDDLGVMQQNSCDNIIDR